MLNSGIGDEIKASKELTRFILTTLAIQVLTVHFPSKKDEFKMIKNKANKWTR